ncbi:MAG TPA: hypothetical protein VF522_18415 [Ramlibacter sp.]|uniref:hypothetical protein n=1 Tax=Ramlibacter sp. TaxID=1917967 RepID=UPI002ED0F655
MRRFPEHALLLALIGASAAALLAATPVPATGHPLDAELPERVRALAASDATIDELRASAVQGNPEASTALASRLLDRYENTGDRTDLDEAMEWIARDWEETHFRRSDVANLVTSGHCVRKALKTHWLCRPED